MIKFQLVLQNKNKINSKGLVLIYLRLTKDRKVKYLATGESCKPIEWNTNKSEVNAKNIHYKTINFNIQNFLSSIKNIYDNTLTTDVKKDLSIIQFVDLIKPKKNNVISTDFYILIKQKIDNLKENGKIGTADYYKDCLNSVLSFCKKQKLDLTEISMEWLQDYEKFLRKKKCIDSGIAVKMRAIRSIYNDAIKQNLISYAFYPFRNYQISKLKGVKRIRSIVDTDFKAIINLDVSNNSKLGLHKDIFLFSYYTGGMNFKDIIGLKSKNVFENGNRIEYTRSKTKSMFNLKLTKPAKEIINKYKENAKITDYVFPILTDFHVTPQQKENRKHKTLSQLNKSLKEFGRLCNVDFDVTSYVARHSTAQHLKEKNVPTDIISELLGHQNIRITQAYLKRFGNDVTDNALDNLI